MNENQLNKTDLLKIIEKLVPSQNGADVAQSVKDYIQSGDKDSLCHLLDKHVNDEDGKVSSLSIEGVNTTLYEELTSYEMWDLLTAPDENTEHPQEVAADENAAGNVSAEQIVEGENGKSDETAESSANVSKQETTQEDESSGIEQTANGAEPETHDTAAEQTSTPVESTTAEEASNESAAGGVENAANAGEEVSQSTDAGAAAEQTSAADRTSTQDGDVSEESIINDFYKTVYQDMSGKEVPDDWKEKDITEKMDAIKSVFPSNKEFASFTQKAAGVAKDSDAKEMKDNLSNFWVEFKNDMDKGSKENDVATDTSKASGTNVDKQESTAAAGVEASQIQGSDLVNSPVTKMMSTFASVVERLPDAPTDMVDNFAILVNNFSALSSTKDMTEVKQEFCSAFNQMLDKYNIRDEHGQKIEITPNKIEKFEKGEFKRPDDEIYKPDVDVPHKNKSYHQQKYDQWTSRVDKCVNYQRDLRTGVCKFMQAYHQYKGGLEVGGKTVKAIDLFVSGVQLAHANILETIFLEIVKVIFDAIDSAKSKDRVDNEHYEARVDVNGDLIESRTIYAAESPNGNVEVQEVRVTDKDTGEIKSLSYEEKVQDVDSKRWQTDRSYKEAKLDNGTTDVKCALGDNRMLRFTKEDGEVKQGVEILVDSRYGQVTSSTELNVDQAKAYYEAVVDAIPNMRGAMNMVDVEATEHVEKQESEPKGVTADESGNIEQQKAEPEVVEAGEQNDTDASEQENVEAEKPTDTEASEQENVEAEKPTDTEASEQENVEAEKPTDTETPEPEVVEAGEQNDTDASEQENVEAEKPTDTETPEPEVVEAGEQNDTDASEQENVEAEKPTDTETPEPEVVEAGEQNDTDASEQENVEAEKPTDTEASEQENVEAEKPTDTETPEPEVVEAEEQNDHDALNDTEVHEEPTDETTTDVLKNTDVTEEPTNEAATAEELENPDVLEATSTDDQQSGKETAVQEEPVPEDTANPDMEAEQQTQGESVSQPEEHTAMSDGSQDVAVPDESTGENNTDQEGANGNQESNAKQAVDAGSGTSDINREKNEYKAEGKESVEEKSILDELGISPQKITDYFSEGSAITLNDFYASSGCLTNDVTEVVKMVHEYVDLVSNGKADMPEGITKLDAEELYGKALGELCDIHNVSPSELSELNDSCFTDAGFEKDEVLQHITYETEQSYQDPGAVEEFIDDPPDVAMKGIEQLTAECMETVAKLTNADRMENDIKEAAIEATGKSDVANDGEDPVEQPPVDERFEGSFDFSDTYGGL